MEEALIETPTMRRSAGIELISDRIPDETTILTSAIFCGDFQERCHSWAAVQAACINGSCPGSLSSSGG